MLPVLQQLGNAYGFLFKFYIAFDTFVTVEVRNFKFGTEQITLEVGVM